VAVLGAVLGTPSAVADAYDLANGTPNMVYELLLGGVLSAALVPLFTDLRRQNDDEGTSAVLSVAGVMLVALTVLAMLAAPLIFHMYSFLTSSTVDAGQYRAVGTALARIFLVQIFFYGINAFATSTLQANRRFMAAAWVPALSNLVIIGSLLLVPSIAHHRSPTLDDVLHNTALRSVLGWGATIGIAVMALSLVPLMLRNDQRLRFSLDFRHPAVQRLSRAGGWALGYVLANQAALVVVRNLLRGGGGDVFAYSRAFLWFMLPHALLAMSVTTTFLPNMTEFAAVHDKPRITEATSLGVRMIALVTLPAGFGLFVLRRSVIGAVFEHGHASSADALQTSRALGGFALGLVGFSVYMFSLRVFYAHHDQRKPFIINCFENLINIVLGIVLSHYYGVLGLAASFAIAYLVSAVVTLKVIADVLRWRGLRSVYRSMGRMLLAAVVMAEAVWFVARHVGANSGIGAVTRTLAGTVAGTIVYVVVLAVLRSDEIEMLIGPLRRRFAPRLGRGS
jgi:putative peptidoglycan lipid II flippase